MGAVKKALEEFLACLMQHRVMSDLVGPIGQLRSGRELTKQDEISNFKKGALLGELLNGISSIPQDALIAIDKGYGALAGRGIHERRIISHESEVFRTG